jgi:hypothetical protein
MIYDVTVLVQKYRPPVKEQVTRALCDELPIIGWALSHESTAVSIFFKQREKLVLDHFQNINEIANNSTQLPINADTSLHGGLLPTTWAALNTFTQNHQANNLPLMLPMDKAIQQNYLDVLAKLELDGKLTTIIGETGIGKIPISDRIELKDLSGLAPPEDFHIVGDRLKIPIIDPINPFKTRLTTEEELDTGLTGMLNGVTNYFGFGKPFGGRLEDHTKAVTLDEAVAQGYITPTQKSALEQRMKNQQLGGAKGGTGEVHLFDQSNINTVPVDTKLQIYVDLDPNRMRPTKSTDKKAE